MNKAEAIAVVRGYLEALSTDDATREDLVLLVLYLIWDQLTP